MKTSTNEVLCDGCREPIAAMWPPAIFATFRGPHIGHRKADFHDMDCLQNWANAMAELKRKVGLKAQGKRTRKSKGHLFPKTVDETYRDWVRQRPCLIASRVAQLSGRLHRCGDRIEVCHVRSRGAGGEDHGNVVAMCWIAHFQQGLLGIRGFNEWWGIGLASAARELYRRYLDEQ